MPSFKGNSRSKCSKHRRNQEGLILDQGASESQSLASESLQKDQLLQTFGDRLLAVLFGQFIAQPEQDPINGCLGLRVLLLHEQVPLNRLPPLFKEPAELLQVRQVLWGAFGVVLAK